MLKILEICKIKISQEKKLTYLFFAILFIKLLVNVNLPFEQYVWWGNQVLPYVLSYKYTGFGQRMFIGSVISIFTNYLEIKNIWIICFIFSIIFNIVFSFIFYLLLNKTKNNEIMYKSVIILSGIFIIYPFCTVISSSHFFTDSFILLLTILTILLINRLNIKHLYLCIIFMIIAIAIHPAVFFLYFPAVFIAILYRFKKENISINKQVLYIILFFLPSFLTMFIFMLYKKISFNDPYEMLEYVNQITDLYYYTGKRHILEFIDGLYFMGLKENFIYNLPSLKIGNIFIIICHHILVIYVMHYFYNLWNACYNKSINSKKMLFVFSMLIPFAIVPLYTGCDYKRWTDSAIICQFIILFNYIYNEEVVVKEYFEKLKQDDKLYIKILWIMLLLFLFRNRTGTENVFKNISLEKAIHTIVMGIKNVI